MMHHVNLPLPISPNLVSGDKEHSGDFSMNLEPLHQLLKVLDREEVRVGFGGGQMTVRGMIGAEDTPGLEMKAKPGDHG